MLPGKYVLMIQVEQLGGVDNRGVGQSQHSLSGSMVLYKGEAATVVGVCIHFLLVRQRRSCGITVGTIGTIIRRVCGKLIGWGCGWVVRGQDKGFIGGDGHGGCFGALNGCGRVCERVGGLRVVVGLAVGMRRLCWEGRGAGRIQFLATAVPSLLSLSLSARIRKGLLCHVRRWCTIGNQRIVLSVVMVFNVVATLGGVAIATLGGGAFSTLGDVGG